MCVAAAAQQSPRSSQSRGRIDALGNSDADEHNWVKANEFAGKRILILNYSGVHDVMNYVPTVLKQAGFEVDFQEAPAAMPDLARADQMWIIAGGQGALTPDDLQRIAEFVKRGKGLYVVSDNDPFTREAHQICQKLHGGSILGNYEGGQQVSIVSRDELQKLSRTELRSTIGAPPRGGNRTRSVGGKNYVEDHEIFSGLKTIVEGYTISHIEGGRDLDIILAASDGQPLVAVSSRPKEKVVFDCGFTRMYHLWEANSVSNTRWYQNVAGYLMGKVRKDLPGRSSLTTLSDLARQNAGGKSRDASNLTAAELLEGFESAAPKLRREILQQLHDAKGSEYTAALAKAVRLANRPNYGLPGIPGLPGPPRGSPAPRTPQGKSGPHDPPGKVRTPGPPRDPPFFFPSTPLQWPITKFCTELKFFFTRFFPIDKLPSGRYTTPVFRLSPFF